MSGAAWRFHPKALVFIGVPSALPPRNSITLLGVYAATHQSLARLPLSVFTSDVHVLRPNLSPGTANLFSHHGIPLAVSDNIFRIKETIHGLITSG